MEIEKLYHSDPSLMNSLIDDIDNWTFMIVDPFDRTYNPAKIIKRDSFIERSLFGAMEATLNQLNTEGTLLLEY